ncbi:hypothetical protein H4687_004341 [Streptomyces stelliscabiei]|uniref:Uncharacterized protein n=1 Tax=Streptomyces stelliscabiei TaxID=146820 RepID=A0A8I0P640_9ACTN|nr:hypothetical protein [Streptomyces stelliscabiei]
MADSRAHLGSWHEPVSDTVERRRLTADEPERDKSDPDRTRNHMEDVREGEDLPRGRPGHHRPSTGLWKACGP